MGAHIKTWQERYALGVSSIEDCQNAELRDLRAALSAQAPVTAQNQPLILDAACKQGKCARSTSGCWGKCYLVDAPYVVNGAIISVGIKP